jgi:DNA-binding GntR family transcriptional regulator
MTISNQPNVGETESAGRQRSVQGRRQTTAPDLVLIDTEAEGSIERKVYDTLRYALMAGKMLPGQMLTSRSLSETLGVSQTPIMVALKRLEADHALKSRNRSAFYVHEPSQEEFREILDIRLTLEVMAIRRAARNVTPKDIAVLHQINRGCSVVSPKTAEERLYQEREALAQNFRFHFEIYRHCGSSTLVTLIERFWLRVGPMLHRYLGHAGVTTMSDLHENIIAALERNDEESAELALRYDLNTAFNVIVPQLPNLVRDDDSLSPRDDV